MPIFDYQCQACGHTFDVLQKVGEGPLRKCPECGKLKLKKQLAAPNFHLKGTGWYQTDFKKQQAERKEEAGQPTAEAKPEAKSDAKADAKTDGKAVKKAHTVDSSQSHSHDHDAKKDSGGHTHSHGGKSHTHGPGGHKH